MCSMSKTYTYYANKKKLEEIIDEIGVKKTNLAETIKIPGLGGRHFWNLIGNKKKFKISVFSELANFLVKVAKSRGKNLQLKYQDIIKLEKGNNEIDLQIYYAEHVKDISLGITEYDNNIIETRCYVDNYKALLIKNLFDALSDYQKERSKFDNSIYTSEEDLFKIIQKGKINTNINALKKEGINTYNCSILLPVFAYVLEGLSREDDLHKVTVTPYIEFHNLWVFCDNQNIQKYQYNFRPDCSLEKIENIIKAYPCTFNIIGENKQEIQYEIIKFYSEIDFSEIDKNFSSDNIHFVFPRDLAELIPIEKKGDYSDKVEDDDGGLAEIEMDIKRGH